MNSPISTPLVFVTDGLVYTSAQQVADMFGKQHGHVLRDIDNLSNSGLIDDPSGFFVPITYIDSRNRDQPSYSLTRDGFSLLAMGFTGDKALGFKLDFIRAFNEMEASLAGRTTAPAIVASKPKSVSLALAVTPVKLSGALLKETRLTLDYLHDVLALPVTSIQCFAASLYNRMGAVMPEPQIKTQAEYSSSELAAQYGLSPPWFGRTVKHLKCDKHGTTRLSVAPSGKQVSVFIWNEAGRAAVDQLLRQSPDLLDE